MIHAGNYFVKELNFNKKVFALVKHWKSHLFSTSPLSKEFNELFSPLVHPLVLKIISSELIYMYILYEINTHG